MANKSGKSVFGFSTVFKGGPLDGEERFVEGFAFYRDVDGDPAGALKSHLEAYIGANKIDGIYCLTDEREYRWVWAARDGKRADERERAFTLERQGIAGGAH